ncbi:hypothetical protein ACTHOQ_01010 [Solibacillus silvestris]|uniref:hypothetical protein n=1 Tax=Solibacillus silvestris TaxID=76853 RepID=UPI003F7D2E53
MVHKHLVLVDAIKAEKDRSVPIPAAQSFEAVILYEGENARVMSMAEEKNWLEQQLFIMPKNEEQTFQMGDKVLVHKGMLYGFQTETGFKQVVVAKEIKKVNTSSNLYVNFKNNTGLQTFLNQLLWETLKQTTAPSMVLNIENKNYSIWLSENGIIIGDGKKEAFIKYEIIEEWGRNLINQQLF